MLPMNDPLTNLAIAEGSAAPGARRPEEVVPPGRRGETAFVVRASFFVVFASILVIGLERGSSEQKEPNGTRSLLAVAGIGEIAFQDLETVDQRMFRQVQEGLVEAESVRASRGTWPEVAEMSAEGIPPFAPDPLDRAGYRWGLLQSGTIVNYLGVPSKDPSRPTLAIVMLEPEPGVPDPNAVEDEVHHRLPDGTWLHVSIWMGPTLQNAQWPAAAPPVERGWKRVVTGQRVAK